MFCQFLTQSKVTQSYTHTHVIFLTLSSIMFLCNTAGSHCLSNPNASFHLLTPDFKSIPLPCLPRKHESILHFHDLFCFVDRSIVPYFRLHIQVISYGILFFFFWLTLLSMRVSGSIHVAANGIILYFFMTEWYSIVYMYHIFLIYSYVNGHLGCFHVLAIVNGAVINISYHLTPVRVAIINKSTNNKCCRGSGEMTLGPLCI